MLPGCARAWFARLGEAPDRGRLPGELTRLRRYGLTWRRITLANLRELGTNHEASGGRFLKAAIASGLEMLG